MLSWRDYRGLWFFGFGWRRLTVQGGNSYPEKSITRIPLNLESFQQKTFIFSWYPISIWIFYLKFIIYNYLEISNFILDLRRSSSIYISLKIKFKINVRTSSILSTNANFKTDNLEGKCLKLINTILHVLCKQFTSYF